LRPQELQAIPSTAAGDIPQSKQLRKVTKENAGNFDSLFGVILKIFFGRWTVIR
jgi:hypothetical protein